jgi:hypothetical protein
VKVSRRHAAIDWADDDDSVVITAVSHLLPVSITQIFTIIFRIEFVF